jgi:hypothetical protein
MTEWCSKSFKAAGPLPLLVSVSTATAARQPSGCPYCRLRCCCPPCSCCCCC